MTLLVQLVMDGFLTNLIMHLGDGSIVTTVKIPKMISENAAILSLGMVLRQAVPTFYICAAVYLSVSGYKHTDDYVDYGEDSIRNESLRDIIRRTTFVRFPYVILFGTTGISTYMVLNEPDMSWIPLWANDEFWLLIILGVALVIGVALFNAIIEKQNLTPPVEYAEKFWQKLSSFLDGSD